MSTHSYRLIVEDTHELLALADPPQGPSDPAQRGTEFRPVDAGDTVASGETLLIEAYAVLWVILFVFLFVSWRRQGRIDARIDELERSLAHARGTKPQ